MAGLFPCSSGPLTQDLKHAFSCHIKESMAKKRHVQHKQSSYLTEGHIHSSRFFTRYSLLSGFSILLHSSFFQFSHFLNPGLFFSLHPNWHQPFSQILAIITASAYSSVTFPPSAPLRFALNMFSLAFVYLEHFLHHSWIKLFKSTSNNLNEKRTFNKIKIIGFKERISWTN